MNAQTVLYLAAAVVLILGAVIDDPRFNVTRCIAFALALLVLAQLVGMR